MEWNYDYLLDDIGYCMAKDQTIVIRGKLDWAKVVGGARPHTGNPKFDKGPYWSVDITPDKASLAKIKEAGIADKLRAPKGNDTRKEKYLSLTILLNKADGTVNDPPKITDGAGNVWPNGQLIGNGSVADIMINVKDYGTTVGAYYRKMRVLEHVPFGGADFEPLSADDEFFASSDNQKAAGNYSKAAAMDREDDLDDDVPFN